MASCAKVTKCLSEGSEECILSSKTCPPCLYALTGGDYSCYSRDKKSGNCPFGETYAECDKPNATPSASSNKTQTEKPPPSPADNNVAPEKLTPAPIELPAGAPPSPETEKKTPETAKTPEPPAAPSTPNTTVASEADKTTTPTAPMPPTDSYTTQTPPQPSDSGQGQTLSNKSTSHSTSPALIDLILVGGLAVLILIVILLVVRRMVVKKKLAHTQQRTVTSSQNSQWSDRTLNTAISGTNLYSTYSYKDEGGKSISMLSASQASSTDYTDQPPIPIEGASPADFSNFGGKNHFAANSQYYSNYSVSTGPAVVGAPYASNGTSSNKSSNFVNVTAKSLPPELDSTRSGRQPLTVSQLMPTGFVPEDSVRFSSRRDPGPLQYGHVPPTVCDSAISSGSRKVPNLGASTASSVRSDYDIVDPSTMRDVDSRNTEMLAEGSHYPKFSFESEGDIYDGSSSEEDDERVRHGEEHTI